MLPLGCPWAASDLIGQRTRTRERTGTGQGQEIATGQGQEIATGQGQEIATGQEGVKKKRDKSRHEWVDNE